MSQELTFEEKSETCGTSAMERAPCSFGRRVEAAKKERSVWLPVLAKLGMGAVAIAAFAGLGSWSMQHTGHTPLSIPEAKAQTQGPWLAASAPAKPENKAGKEGAAPSLSPCAAASTKGDSAPDTKSPAGVASNAKTSDGKVILNAAEVADLVKLPGVGPKRAQAILDLRARLGRFRKVADLLRVRGIGVKGLKKIEPFVVIDVPPVS